MSDEDPVWLPDFNQFIASITPEEIKHMSKKDYYQRACDVINGALLKAEKAKKAETCPW